MNAFVLSETRRSSVGSVKWHGDPAACFLRFLHVEGEIARDLTGAVPSVASWRLAGWSRPWMPDARRSVAQLRSAHAGRPAGSSRSSRCCRGWGCAPGRSPRCGSRHRLALRRGHSPRQGDSAGAAAAAGGCRRGARRLAARRTARCESRARVHRVRAPLTGLTPTASQVVKPPASGRGCRSSTLTGCDTPPRPRCSAPGGASTEVGQVLRHRSRTTPRSTPRSTGSRSPRSSSHGRERRHEPARRARRAVSHDPPRARVQARQRRAMLASSSRSPSRRGGARSPPRPHWLGQTANARQPATSRRLRAVRGFAALPARPGPACEVPPLDLLPARKYRAAPYIYSDAEILALMQAARQLRPPVTRRDLRDPDRAAGVHRDADRRGDQPGPRRHRPDHRLLD